LPDMVAEVGIFRRLPIGAPEGGPPRPTDLQLSAFESPQRPPYGYVASGQPCRVHSRPGVLQHVAHSAIKRRCFSNRSPRL
jgi:hypothetical protein